MAAACTLHYRFLRSHYRPLHPHNAPPHSPARLRDSFEFTSAIEPPFLLPCSGNVRFCCRNWNDSHLCSRTATGKVGTGLPKACTPSTDLEAKSFLFPLKPPATILCPAAPPPLTDLRGASSANEQEARIHSAAPNGRAHSKQPPPLTPPIAFLLQAFSPATPNPKQLHRSSCPPPSARQRASPEKERRELSAIYGLHTVASRKKAGPLKFGFPAKTEPSASYTRHTRLQNREEGALAGRGPTQTERGNRAWSRREGTFRPQWRWLVPSCFSPSSPPFSSPQLPGI